jgi:hypothetical protein
MVNEKRFQLIQNIGIGDVVCETSTDGIVSNIRLLVTNNLIEFGQNKQNNIIVEIPINIVFVDRIIAFTPLIDGTFIVGINEPIIGTWKITTVNNFNKLSFNFQNNILIINEYSCLLIDDIPQKNFSLDIGEGEYPVFLNLFLGNTWTSYIQNQICLLYTLQKNPLSNYTICPIES